MAGQGTRFRPPQLEFEPELRWVFVRAFAPPDAPVAGPPERALAVQYAELLNVAARIAARVPLEQLQDEVGADNARALLVESARAAEIGRRHLAFARQLAAAAAECGVPLCFLKGTALALTGAVEPAARWITDLDVLVPADDAPRLHRALQAAGMRVEDVHPSEHQLPPLFGSRNEMVEVHTRLRGIRRGKTGYAQFDELRAADLLAPAPAMPAGCFVPIPALLLGHAMVHAFAQHGLTPESYPLARALGDLIDLGLASPRGEALLEEAWPLLAEDLERADAAAVVGLCGLLAAGSAAPFEPASGAPAATLLRHIVAGLLDRDYAESLRLRALLETPTGKGRARALLCALWSSTMLTRTQVEQIYGRPRTPFGYVGRRLARPLDLAWRLARYGWSALAVRRRAPRLG